MYNIKFEIEVTQDDINNGCKEQGDNCPVALATKRAFKKCHSVHVGSEIEVAYTNAVITFDKVPAKVDNWIKRFDQGKKVKPFKFVLTAR